MNQNRTPGDTGKDVNGQRMDTGIDRTGPNAHGFDSQSPTQYELLQY